MLSSHTAPKKHREGVSQDTGGGRLAKKNHREVRASRILGQDVGGLDFASQFSDVGGFVSKRFSPKQRHQIDTNQASVNNAKSD